MVVSMHSLLKKNLITAPADMVKWDNLMMDLAQRIDRAIPELGLLEKGTKPEIPRKLIM